MSYMLDSLQLICFAAAGSPIISPAGWKRLLQEQGFEHATVAGESLEAPPLLSRQAVVLGISDGNIQVTRASGTLQGAAKGGVHHLGLQAQQALSSTGAQVQRCLRHCQTAEWLLVSGCP